MISRIANRIVRGVGAKPGELIQVRDDTGRFDLLAEVLLAIEQAGAVPLPQITPISYMERLWRTASVDYLARWDQFRTEWLTQVDRVIVLAGAQPDLSDVSEERFLAWAKAEQRLTELEESRELPYLLVAVPTRRRAAQLGLSYDALANVLNKALTTELSRLQGEIERVLYAVYKGETLVIETGDPHQPDVLHCQLGPRPWHSDDGYIDDADRQSGAIVSNLPAGSIYTTVIEEATEGTLFLPQASMASNVRLTFDHGRVTDIQADNGAEELAQFFDQHSGEPRRIGHIGLGLNPDLKQSIGWTLVDEHVHGHLFVSFGENRYMGGQNESSLNVDFAVPQATLRVNGRVLVKNGRPQ